MRTALSLAEEGPAGGIGCHLAPVAPGVAAAGTDESDEALMARIRAGDQDAYRRLVRRHLKRAYALARRMSGSDAEAEDIAQDAFLQIWQRRAQWSDEGARFTTWLYRVIVNRSIDHRRRPVGQDLDAAPEPADAAPDAVSLIQRRQVATRLGDACRRLPPPQQAAVTLFYFEGLSAADTASVMQISLGAVESLLKRARQQLRGLLRASAQAAKDAFDD